MLQRLDPKKQATVILYVESGLALVRPLSGQEFSSGRGQKDRAGSLIGKMEIFQDALRIAVRKVTYSPSCNISSQQYGAHNSACTATRRVAMQAESFSDHLTTRTGHGA
jgi:hypothetical protein